MTESAPKSWPELPDGTDWFDTLETLHLWTQVIGKIRLVCSPWVNDSWSVPLYVSPTGLHTSVVPYEAESFEWSFDFGHSALDLVTSTAQQRRIELHPRTVADFYAEVMDAMDSVGMPVSINTTPNEIADAVPFPEDTEHDRYDPDHARLLWRALHDAHRVFTRFRAGFLGKASPVHFFWGSFDLATTRFSGRLAPPHPGGMPNFPDDVAREAYSHELTSCGFWPGNHASPSPIFYAYAYPTPGGYASSTVEPSSAFWLEDLGEFALRYADVERAEDPDDLLLSFVESAHAKAAELADWDRGRLECADPHGPDWWQRRPDGGWEAQQ